MFWRKTEIAPFLAITALEKCLLLFSIKLCAKILKKWFQATSDPLRNELRSKDANFSKALLLSWIESQKIAEVNQTDK